jgi:hypothetical protein
MFSTIKDSIELEVCYIFGFASSVHKNFILTLSGTGFFNNIFRSDKEIEARKEVERRLEASRVSWEAERTELEARLTHLQVGRTEGWEDRAGG